MIETMQKEGYVLVNEVAEHGYIDGFLGAVAATTYTLTFRRKPEPEKNAGEISAENRLKEEKHKARSEAAKKAAETRKQKKAEEDRIICELTSALGEGSCELTEVTRKNLKSTLQAIFGSAETFVNENGYITDRDRKEILGILKKFGKYFMLVNYGKNACENLTDILKSYGAEARVIEYDKTQYEEQIRPMFMKNRLQEDIFSYLLKLNITRIAWDKLGEGVKNPLGIYELLTKER